MLYPVELWVRAAATAANHFGEKWRLRQRGYGFLIRVRNKLFAGIGLFGSPVREV